MATLVLTAVGTALGGPLGGAIGALAGRMVDSAIIGSPKSEGPRIKDLAVTTSSYGSYIPRHFGKVRAAGSIIWATDLVEHSESSGGGKGQPSVTTYNYTISFAVALASRPIKAVGRIWADGNLLRGGRGDLKAGGKMRLYTGREDQRRDPLIASDMGQHCPAFRGLAYVVFDNLQLADFGNRIPALTFEIIADDGTIRLTQMLSDPYIGCKDDSFDELTGFTHDGGSDADLLATFGDFYPLAFDASGGDLDIRLGRPSPDSRIIDLPPPVASKDGDFAKRTGRRRNRRLDDAAGVVGLRYYDLERDYQPGLQRSRGKAGKGRMETIEFPACLTADRARVLANRFASRRECSRETMSYRIATVDRELVCGSLVRPAGERGVWQVVGWEWRSGGVDLELEAIDIVSLSGLIAPADPGLILGAEDALVGQSLIHAFELPWDGTGSSSERKVFAALSSASAGWKGAALYVDKGAGQLWPAGTANRSRVILGTVLDALAPASPHLFDRQSEIVIELVDDAFALDQSDMAGLAQGNNRALIGGEIVQFGSAVAMGSGRWRISSFLRGLGGTESASSRHSPGEAFVLLNDALTLLDIAAIEAAASDRIFAFGNGDTAPITARIVNPGIFMRPLAPVKPRAEIMADGSRRISWVRRSRGAWQWRDEVEAPLPEIEERYDIRARATSGEWLSWSTKSPSITIDPANWSRIEGAEATSALEIRQIGPTSLSHPLLLRFE